MQVILVIALRRSLVPLTASAAPVSPATNLTKYNMDEVCFDVCPHPGNSHRPVFLGAVERRAIAPAETRRDATRRGRLKNYRRNETV